MTFSEIRTDKIWQCGTDTPVREKPVLCTPIRGQQYSASQCVSRTESRTRVSVPHLGPALQQEARHIVVLRSVAHEGIQFFEQAAQKFGGRGRYPAIHQPGQLRLSILVSLGVDRLYDSVGKDHQVVPGAQSGRLHPIRGILENSQRDTSRLEP